MYPFIRLAWQHFIHRNSPALEPTDTHISHHICWPWDLDMWMELNNGRTLTLYDMGRLPMAQRMGLLRLLKQQCWGLTIAGSAARYRRRIRMFDRIEMRSRALCWDRRFIYLEQSMWTPAGDCAGQCIYRAAVVGPNGIVSPDQVMAVWKPKLKPPSMPAWIQAWSNAENQRPWPPEQH